MFFPSSTHVLVALVSHTHSNVPQKSLLETLLWFSPVFVGIVVILIFLRKSTRGGK
jgi:hypothetical protein